MRAGLFEQESGFVRCSIGVVGDHDDVVLPWWRVGGVFREKDLQVGNLIKINGKLFQVKDVVTEYISDQVNGVYPSVFGVILELVK